MKKDYYNDYNHDRYIHYRQVKVSHDVQDVKTDKGTMKRMNPVMEKRIIPFDEIKELKLDSYGTLHPQLDTEDYFIVGNYLMDFWGAILGSDAVQVYLHLLRYAYGKKDFCFPDIEIIALKMKRSYNYIKKQLNILEEHHFVAKFNRYDSTDNNREVSPFFKIRRFIPLITDDMYKELDPKLQKMHDDFISQYDNLSLTNELTEKNAVINEMVIDKRVMANKKMRGKIEQMIDESNKYDYIIERIDLDSKDATVEFHYIIEGKVSKPSFDTWINHLIFVKDDSWIIVAPNDFVLEWVQNNYLELFKEWLPINTNDKFKLMLSDKFIEDYL